MGWSSDALDAAAYTAAICKRINGGDMSLIDAAQGNALSSLIGGQGIVGGAIANGAHQAMAMNNTQQKMWNAAQSQKIWGGRSPYEERKPAVELMVKIVQAENGFVVGVGNSYGDLQQQHIAITIEDINTIITSQLASRMLDRSEG